MIPSRIERRHQVSKPLPPERERRRTDEYRVRLAEQWARGWLAFETRGEKRRLAPYPDGWEDLSDAELFELCDRAVPVTPSRRLVE